MKHYIIKYNEKEFEASEYQDAIFNEVETGVGNIVISAAAGASKTTTIVNCMDIINNKSVLFIAFNKEIIEDIKKKVNNKNAKVMDFHSLGYSILKENFGKYNDDNIDQYKYKNYIKNNINNITCYHEIISLNNNKNNYINNIINLVEYCRYYLAFSKREIKNVADKYGITPIRDEFDVCREVLIWGKENYTTIDFTDMIWLPNVLNLTTKRYIFDWIMIDEGQDTSIAEQQLVWKCKKRGCRFIIVGDEHQQINVWCGASEEAINFFKEQPNTKTLKLPICYRCGTEIINLAKKYSDNIKAPDEQHKGEIRIDVSKYDPKPGDMVLCRMTAPLIDLHLKYLQINKASYLKGSGKIKEQYNNLISYCISNTIDKECLSSNGLFPVLYTKLFDEIERIKNTYNITFDDAIVHPTIITMYDNIEGLKVLSQGLVTVDELKDKINTIFENNDSNAIQLSTVHKAKGLEADNVYILLPSLMPSKMAKQEWEKKTENNLIYVAITRAKKSLSFIKEEKFKNFNNGIFDIASVKSTLETIKKRIDYNIENGLTINKLPKQENKLLKTQILGSNVNKGQTIVPNSGVKGGLKYKRFMI